MIFDFIFRSKINECKQLNNDFNCVAKIEAKRLKEEYKKKGINIDVSGIGNNEFIRGSSFCEFTDMIHLEFLKNNLNK